MKRRYRICRDFYAGLIEVTEDPSAADWAVYDDKADEEWPIAVFARRGDAIAFRRMKEAK